MRQAAIITTFIGLLIATSASAAEPIYRLDAKGFVRDWIVGNPYPSYVTAAGESLGHDTDALAHLGGEANYEPFAGFEEDVIFAVNRANNIEVGASNEWGYLADQTFVAKWQPRHSDVAFPIGFVNPVKRHVIGYAACYVMSSTSREVRVGVGRAGDYTLFVNHRLIAANRSTHEFHPDDASHLVRLNEGVNLFLLKLVDHGVGHQFSLSIRNLDGTPCSDLQIRLDNPRAKLRQRYPQLHRIDGLANGLFGQIDIAPDAPTMPGRLTATISLGAETATEASATIRATGPNGTLLLDQTLSVRLDGKTLTTLQRSFSCAEAGDVTLAVNVARSAGSVLIQRRVQVLSAEQLERESSQLQDACRTARTQVQTLTAELDAARETHRQARDAIAEQYRTIESLYEKIRLAQRQRLGSAGASIDEPAPPGPAEPRATMILNGDAWEIAPAVQLRKRNVGPAGGYLLDFDTERIPTQGWSPMRVPFTCFQPGHFGINYHLPVRWTGKDGAPETIQPFAGRYVYNPTRTAHGLWHRLTFDLPAGWETRTAHLQLTNTQAWAKVFVNGTFCGQDSGFVAPYRIALKNLRAGKNELVIFIGSGRTKYAFATPCDDRWYPFWGIRGDVVLETAPALAIDDVYLTTTVRTSHIRSHVTLRNPTAQPATLTLRSYATLNGRIKKRLPDATVTAPAGQTIDTAIDAPWTDAQLWGIGGRYGSPTLYTMVTELWQGTHCIDRTLTRFGFREFWIEAGHFYLNGKRILLRGDVSGHTCVGRNRLHVFLPLLRQCGINTIRNHDDEIGALDLPEVADELGMLVIMQNYPFVDPWPLPRKDGAILGFLPIAKFLNSPMHKENIRNYTRWVKSLRNHPSVVIYSMDNEMFLQNWEHTKRKPYALRNDQVGAWYGRFVKQLDPTRIITRDGDQGTWGPPLGCWSETPPCETANYHYPETDASRTIENWQTTFGGRPVIFGETLYCSYTSFNNWCGPIPKEVAKKAALVRDIVGRYERAEIPGAIFMGLSSDGFVETGPTGHSPWKDAPAEDMRDHPYPPIAWPSLTGAGRKDEFAFSAGCLGVLQMNWFDPKYPAATPNAVNVAYAETLAPMPPLNPRRRPELLVHVTAAGQPLPHANVTVRAIDPQPTQPQIVPTDAAGCVTLVLPAPGTYQITCRDTSATVPVHDTPLYPVRAGFDYLNRATLEVR